MDRHQYLRRQPKIFKQKVHIQNYRLRHDSELNFFIMIESGLILTSLRKVFCLFILYREVTIEIIESLQSDYCKLVKLGHLFVNPKFLTYMPSIDFPNVFIQHTLCFSKCREGSEGPTFTSISFFLISASLIGRE